MHRRSFLTLLSATAAGTALASCSTGPAEGEGGSASQPADPSAAAKGAFPVTIKHVYGSTTIESAPARVATLAYTDHDTVLALGLVPVGATKISYGGNKAGSTDHFDAELKKVGGKQPVRYSDADGIPIDEVAKTRPDLILATNSGLTKEEYTKLTKIAPVIAYPELEWGTPWRTSLEMIGKALGREDKAKQLRVQTEKAIKDARAKYPQLNGKSAGWLTFATTDLSKFSIYSRLDMRPQMLKEFGMGLPSSLKKQLTDTKKFFIDISAEKASSLDADVVVFYSLGKAEDKKLLAHPLIGKIPALKNGSYLASADQAVDATLSAPTPLSIPVAIEKFLPQLAKAAGKVED